MDPAATQPARLHRGRAMTTTALTPEPVKVWTDSLGAEGYLHGTKADLKPGDLVDAGRASNFGDRKSAAFVYLTATLDVAPWGAELGDW